MITKDRTFVKQPLMSVSYLIDRFKRVTLKEREWNLAVAVKVIQRKKTLSTIRGRGRFPQDLSFTLHRELTISPGKCKLNGKNNRALRVESQVCFERDQDGMTLSELCLCWNLQKGWLPHFFPWASFGC